MSNAQSKSLGGRFSFPGTNLAVNRMGYGAMQLAGPQVFGPPKDPDAAVAVLKEAIASGVDHIDTSDFYGPHVTNQIIKRALHPYPKDLVIVTKVGAKRGPDASWNRAESPAELRSAIDDNLRNLGLESLDIVNMRIGLLALGDAPVKAHVEVLAQLKKEGKIKHIGLSNVTAKQFAEARAVTEIVCVQNLYNLAHRGDDAFIDQLAKEGVAYVPFFPLGGFAPLQSTTLSDVAKSARSDADAGRSRLAPSAVAEHSAHPRHVVGRAPARKPRRGEAAALAEGDADARYDRRAGAGASRRRALRAEREHAALGKREGRGSTASRAPSPRGR